MSLREIRTKLRGLASPERALVSARFFKTGPGQYGEGDVFLGIRVPDLRKLARQYRSLRLDQVQILLQSGVHEERLLALLVLVEMAARPVQDLRRDVYRFYLANTAFVNNWDLVDASAPQVVGVYLEDKSHKPLYGLARSASLWERRIAIVATQYFIGRHDFADTLKIAKLLLRDKEDLIHKAAGWMLREVGKRHSPTLEAFLDQHCARMPRTMLRYAIERFAEPVRRAYLAGTSMAEGQ